MFKFVQIFKKIKAEIIVNENITKLVKRVC